MKLFLAKNLDEMREMCVKRSEDLDSIPQIGYQQNVPTPNRVQPTQMHPGPPADLNADPIISQQSPSMQRLMEKNPDLIPRPPVPVTPAAAMALQDRQNMIKKAINGKRDKRSDA